MNKDLKYDVGSLCFWSWNAKLDQIEICRQLKDFSLGRFSGVVIHARAGLEDDYMGSSWFSAYETAVFEAARLGLDVWIYDEDGWPSGFAGGSVPALGDEYCLKKMKACLGVPKAGTILAVYRSVDETGRRVRAAKTDIREVDLVFYVEISRHYVDLLSEKTVAAFIEATHERYRSHLSKYFGTTIKGVFTDEPQLNTEWYPWSYTLEEAYEAEYHEDLLDSLYLLHEDGPGYQQFRYRFWKLLRQRMYQSFTKQIADWCEKNHLMMTGHFGAEDGLCWQVGSQGGVMLHYAAMQMPGIDHLGNRITTPALMKQASSVAHQMGKPYVLSETFGCGGWNISFSQLAWIWGRQSALGVTTPCFHLSPLSIHGRRKRDYPAFFSYHELWWNQFAEFIHWMDRLNEYMCEGERIVDVLVISPLYSAMASYTLWPETSGSMAYYSSQYRLLLENLLDAQVDFEIGDEEILAQYGRVEQGRIRVGNASYGTVLVSPAMSLEAPVCRLLEEFTKQGGRLAFINMRPQMIGMYGADRDIVQQPARILQNRRDMIEKWVRAEALERLVRVVCEDTLKTVAGTVIHTRIVCEGYRVHIWTDEYFNAERAVILLEGAYTVTLYDAQYQKYTVLRTRQLGHRTMVWLPMTAKSNYLLEVRKESLRKEVMDGFSVCRRIEVPKPRLCHDNCLTIDYAKMSVNGEPYSACMPVICMGDTIYEKQNGSDLMLQLQYTFTCSEGFVPQKLSLVAEEEYLLQIEVNGSILKNQRIGWWLDRCMGEFNIGGYVLSGENAVTLTYRVPLVKSDLDENGDFETAKNRFFYPVEAESIYLRGDFDVDAGVPVVFHGRNYSIQNGGFKLVPWTEKLPGELTEQGLWFYRGNVEYRFQIRKAEKGRRQLLEIKEVYAPCIEWEIGGHTGVLFQPDNMLCITDYLAEGENTVCIRLVGSNRNLLGPHHHKIGESNLVGPCTFSGEYGYLEEFVLNQEIPVGSKTWTDDYSFVRFGCCEIWIKEG